MSNKKSITVIGATGNLGVPVVKNLINSGYNVKVIARNENKARQLFGDLQGIGITQADLTDVAALKAALKQTSYLYLNLSTNTTDLKVAFATEREGIANIIEAVDRDTIRQIITISGLGAFDNHYTPGGFEFIPNIIRKQGHKILKDSGIPYTILHCSWFADSFVFYRRNGAYAVIGNTHSPIFFTNCFDYSMHLMNAIGNEEAMYKEFPIQGTTGLRHAVAATTFLSVFSKESKVKVIPLWIIRVMAALNKKMKFLKHMAEYFTYSTEEFIAEDCNTYKVLGYPKLSLEDYATKLKNENFYNYLTGVHN